jgi:beta-N-acetylhexosaminidase
MNLAPVLDVNSNPDNPVIGVRSYSSDPHIVKVFGISMMKGLLSSGVMATVKHFPGHGDTAVDSHLGLPVVDKEEKELMQRELIPFQRAIWEGAPCIMTSHILFPKLETQRKPATMSKAILAGLLREKLGFEGLIITDCLEMSAIKTFYGTARGSVEAVKAGAQLLCISHTPALVMEAIEEIESAVETGEIAEELIDKAVANILKFKATYRIDINQLEANGIDRSKNKTLVQEMIRSGITQISTEELPKLTTDTVFVGSYAYRSTLASSSVDQELHFAKYMAEKLHCRYIDVPVNPVFEDRSRVLSELSPETNIIYGLYNGHLNLGQLELAKEISRNGYELVAITLRNPYDLALLDPKVHKIAAYEYNRPVFDALASLLKKEFPAKGNLPVALTI